MPAINDDPTAPVIYRTSGQPPYPDPTDPHLPPTIFPRQVTLRDRVTVASLIPFSSVDEVPHSLVAYLCDQLNKEIEKGDTYPILDPLATDAFGPYWFSNFGAVMLLGDITSIQHVQNLAAMEADWGKICLGSFNIKPNYPGRSSHICNGTFLVTDASRNRGVGRLMGEGYLEWAPQLGYTYSVFNLVYETNVVSCRIWDALGFKRIGRVPGSGNLRSHPGQLVDAIIYGRDLGPEGEDFVSEERFDKIRYYLKHAKYPSGADRAEKSRLRSAATHYKLVGGQNGEPEVLMLKDKEVISDPQQQYEIARQVHLQQHGGINKTTATIALKYHWVRIKETVSMVIKNCSQCKEGSKSSLTNTDATPNPKREKAATTPRKRSFEIPTSGFETTPEQLTGVHQFAKNDPFSTSHSQILHDPEESMPDYSDIPLDPQIMEDIHQHLPTFQHHNGIDPYETEDVRQPHGLPHEFDPQMDHHDPTSSYTVVEEDEVMGSQAAAALREQTMRLVDTSRLHDAQFSQELLDFSGRDDTSNYNG